MQLNRLSDIEVPLGDHGELLKLRQELSYVLRVVDFALGVHEVAPEAAASASVSTGYSYVPPAKADANEAPKTLADRIRAEIDRAEERFTSAEIYAKFPPSARNSIKIELKNRRMAGEIEVVTMGKGRIATIYRKTAKSLI